MLATKLTTKEVETKLYDFFTEKMLHDELSNIDNVQTFKDYLATYDNGLVIDTADGTQIVLTIQTR